MRSISGQHFLGKRLKAPILISSMTGGFDLARKVNRNLAAAAQTLGLAMGVGSQRVAIEEPSAAASFQVRDVAPDILLLGNLGAVQLNYGYGIDQCRRAVAMIGADGLILHLNVLQEAVQPEGNRNFKGLTAKIAAVCRELDVPVVAKEVGNGISVDVAVRLHARRREGHRCRRQRRHVVVRRRSAARRQDGQTSGLGVCRLGNSDRGSVISVRQALPDIPLVASGGIRTGVDMAKAIALGADLAALGQPLLAAALESADKVVEFLAGMIHEIKVSDAVRRRGNLGASTASSMVRRPA